MQVKDAITGAELEQFLAEDIRRRATHALSGRAVAFAGSDSAASIRIQEWLRAAQESATSIGRMPPVSSTFRSRVGEVLVRLVRRMLFWYTPQIVSFNTAAVGVMREQSTALSQLNASVQRLEKRLAEMEGDAPDLELLVEQAGRAIESGGIAILETSNPETLCALLEKRTGASLEVVRHGPRLYALTARKPACGS